CLRVLSFIDDYLSNLISPELTAMANPEHLKILKKGVKAWNEWREAHREVIPDLTSADLTGSDLSRADFSRTDLSGAILTSANLTGAGLTGAVLTDADLSGAHLFHANLSHVRLSGTKFQGSIASHTMFADIDLRGAVGLESVDHRGPSKIDIITIYKSDGKIPKKFLRGCGVPYSFIKQIPTILKSKESIQYYSCFISYSSKDQDFADRLYADLQNKGVRCWFAPEDLKIGDRFRDRIDGSIRLHDKSLLILSKSSVSSQWVGDEVEAALERERRENRLVLFPIQIDNAITESDTGWAAAIRRRRHTGDFTRWNDHVSYQKAFNRLLRDLKAEEKKP
ncbi:MAG TPA: toll/interleukin-1 receptor domain-containing protein, partial [Nitrososphaera sp.]|nr:toll/interleukin-1 receptor domain-containing protein [Nitrososphaera sp.]